MKKQNKSSLFLFAFILNIFLITWGIVSVEAQLKVNAKPPGKGKPAPTVQPLITNPSYQWHPSVSDEWVVYDDNRNYLHLPLGESGWDVYAYNFITGEEIRLTSNYTMNPHYPQIFDDKVVYHNDPDDDMDIYMYDLSSRTEVVITEVPLMQRYPAIHRHKIVWMDGRNPSNQWDVFLYDFKANEVIQVTNDSYAQQYPDIYGNIVVWQDKRYGHDDVYMYDLSTGVETRVTSAEGDQQEPKIYGKKIVWHDKRIPDQGPDIYMYDISTGQEIQITSSEIADGRPKIYKDKIAFNHHTGGSGDVYLYDIKKATLLNITNNQYTQTQVDLWNDIVAWIDHRNGNRDIYIYK